MALHLLVFLGTEPSRAAVWLAWLLTYAAHAVVWTGAATLLERQKSLLSSMRHMGWKMALFGPLATALLASAVPWAFGRTVDQAPYFREVSVLSLTDTVVSTVSLAERKHGESTTGLVAACALATTALGLLRFTTSALQLWRNLRGRNAVEDARLLQRLERMRARIGLRRVVLTEGANVGSPLVIGLSEICVPQALLTTLSDAEVDGVLAHELAHLERRDGLWFPVVGLLQSVLWMQPCNHWAASRYRQTAELACDDRAVELTRDPWTMARALTRVAAGVLLAHRRRLVPTMARSRSTLLPRVKRLADARSPAEFQASGRARPWALASLLAAGVATASMSLQVAQAQPSPPDAAAASKRMADLARRAQELEVRIESATNLPGADQAGTPASVQVLELQQELRHVRAAEVWTEERFVDEVTIREKRSAVSGRVRSQVVASPR